MFETEMLQPEGNIKDQHKPIICYRREYIYLLDLTPIHSVAMEVDEESTEPEPMDTSQSVRIDFVFHVIFLCLNMGKLFIVDVKLFLLIFNLGTFYL